MSVLRFLIRGLRLLVHLSLGILLVTVVNLSNWPLKRPIAPEPLTQWWNARLFKIFGIRLRVHGQPVEGGHVTIANHVSWLDIPLIAACKRTRFVSKAEVRHWPIAGWLANAAGSFYIRRGKGGARPLLNQLTPFLQNGGSVTIFPEGTTTDGRSLLPFHPRLFAAAVEAQRPIQPVALRFGATPDGRHIAPYIGDDVLLLHIFRLLASPPIEADVHFLPPIAATGRDRDQLAQLSRQAILAVVAPGAVQTEALVADEAVIA